jgi:hypothetical protein
MGTTVASPAAAAAPEVIWVCHFSQACGDPCPSPSGPRCAANAARIRHPDGGVLGLGPRLHLGRQQRDLARVERVQGLAEHGQARLHAAGLRRAVAHADHLRPDRPQLAAAPGSSWVDRFFEDQFESVKTARHFLGTTRTTHHQKVTGSSRLARLFRTTSAA